MNPEAADLELSVDAGPGVDDDELERLARSLRAELLELDVDAVEPATTGPAPDGARAVEALMVGALVVRLARDSEALSSLVRTVRGWLGADAGPQRADRARRRRPRAEPAPRTRSDSASSTRWIERHGRA